MTCPMEIAGQAGTAAAGAPVDDLTTDDDDSAFSLVRRFFLRFLIGRNLSEYSWHSWTTVLITEAWDSMSKCAVCKKKPIKLYSTFVFKRVRCYGDLGWFQVHCWCLSICSHTFFNNSFTYCLKEKFAEVNFRQTMKCFLRIVIKK